MSLIQDIETTIAHNAVIEAEKIRTKGEHTMTTETHTIQEFIDTHKITMESEPAFENPSMAEESAVKMRHFQIQITGPGGVMLCHYSVGTGVVERFLKDKYPQAKLHIMGYRTIYQDEFIPIHAKEYRPGLVEVLDCLANDASGYEQCRDFGDWAGDYGYDTDSRTAEATWLAVGKISHDLRYALGLDVYRQLLEEVERL